MHVRHADDCVSWTLYRADAAMLVAHHDRYLCYCLITQYANMPPRKTDSSLGATELRIVRLLAQKKGREATLTDLSRELKLSKPTVHRSASRLADRAIVMAEAAKTSVGREARYRLLPYLSILRIDPASGTITSFTAGVAPDDLLLTAQVPQPEIRTAVHEAVYRLRTDDILSTKGRPRIRAIVVFGSAARGEATWKSDIDIAIFDGAGWRRKEEDRMREILADLSTRHGHLFSPHFLPSEVLPPKTLLGRAVAESGMIVYAANGGDEVWRSLKRYGGS